MPLWQLLKAGYFSFTNEGSRSWSGCDQYFFYQDRIKCYGLFFKLREVSGLLSRQNQSCAGDMVGFVGHTVEPGRRDYYIRAVIRDLEYTGWFQKSLRGRIGLCILCLFCEPISSAASLFTLFWHSQEPHSCLHSPLLPGQQVFLLFQENRKEGWSGTWREVTENQTY